MSSFATGLGPWALACGIALGVGLWTLLGMVPRFARPRLLARVAPHVSDVSEEAHAMQRARNAEAFPVLGALLGPVLARLRRILSSVLGGGASVELRLHQAGSRLTLEAFRSRQLVWGVIGLGTGTVLATVLGSLRPTPLILAVAVVIVAGVAGVLLCDWLLQRRAASRIARITAELPLVLEFLSLSLSAGEGILDALRRVAHVSRGELSGELGSVLAEVNTGLPLSESLTRCARQLQLPAFTRCVEQVTGALERGSPLAEVLRAQAQDARDDTKRHLLEVAGKKEVTMLIPLVFLILPITVIFAIFPGVFVLQLGF
ncbi:type II secretion system F family protein [Homoserinimonas aerilata]|uniref:type II secretion system F family protein n=1 Tax=Homoserinimonas aerilata TaxID=1162970 RepID=UPI001FEC96BF|nr:type II secretion system F family protein [Homoserinimonas aerilata]